MQPPIDAKLGSGSVSLLALAPEHLPVLRNMELTSELAFRWRLGGRHPSPDEHAAMAWDDVLCTFLVFTGHDRGTSPVGIVTAYHPDHASGHVRIAASRLGPATAHSPSVMQGIFVLVDYVFTGWNFRKIYFEVPDYNLAQFGSAIGTLLELEGSMKEYSFLDGRYWDLHFLALHRDNWMVRRGKLLR